MADAYCRCFEFNSIVEGNLQKFRQMQPSWQMWSDCFCMYNPLIFDTYKSVWKVLKPVWFHIFQNVKNVKDFMNSSVWVTNSCVCVCVSVSFHSWTVPAASGATGPDAQTAAGADPAATASQHHRLFKQLTCECAEIKPDCQTQNRTWSCSFFLHYWLKLNSCSSEPGKYFGPGQRSVRRLSPCHRRPAGSQNKRGAKPRRWSERRPLPLRYSD